MQKVLLVAVACFCLVSSIKAQSMADLMMYSAMFGNRGNSGSSSSTPSASSGGLASLLSGAASTGASSSSTGSSSGGASSALASLAGRSGGASNMFGRLGPAMMFGGAEMSNMMEYYTCGMLRVPPHMCFMMMQQNM